MNELNEKVKKAIERLKAFEPEGDSYYLCYSGGKDSDCVRILAQLANVRHELYYNVTGCDAPKTVYYIKSVGAKFSYYRYKDGKAASMFNLIPRKKYPPTRFKRYCCEYLKESGGKGRMKVTGVRWAESKNRTDNSGLVKVIGKPKTMLKKAERSEMIENVDYRRTEKKGLVLNLDNDLSRRFVESCYRTTSTLLNPIIDWSDSDVREFLRYYGCEGNPLYQCGYKRVGCVGCPMAGYDHMREEMARYPEFKRLYIKAFSRMLKEYKEVHPDYDGFWRTGYDVYKFWLGEDLNQLSFFDEEEAELYAGL